jgi:hypothetical protein
LPTSCRQRPRTHGSCCTGQKPGSPKAGRA